MMTSLFKKLLVVVGFMQGMAASAQTTYHEPYRPQLHFSPQAHWMNDPNGMVYYKGVYHLFFQYYPGGIVWGPMHWGHAESRDLIHWKQLPIALYPDSLGYIFSGSAVVDSNNTSGFGKNGKVPLVAIFTHHDPKGEKAGTNNFQNESIAYSLDNGKSWTKYAGNPVVKNPGIRDFRDPKVMWYAAGKKWIMTLATKNRITFYSSPDLKNWNKESEFGLDKGAHGGVWECPDLFPLKLGGKTRWVLTVNIGSGGPNGGPATQYFTGDFDGNKFVAADDKTRWLDYGPDEYAGVTWSNTGSRKIFLGWMSNWEYANQLPTATWRNAMTIPRDLALKNVNGNILAASEPVKKLSSLKTGGFAVKKVIVDGLYNLTRKIGRADGQYELKFNIARLKDFSVILSNKAGEELVIGYNSKTNHYYIDRTKSGKVDFSKYFAGNFEAPRFVTGPSSDFTLVIDNSSVEFFADGGLSVMSCLFFPNKPYRKIQLQAGNETAFSDINYMALKSIW
jgi:fructan beta-fructosidase